jgi:chorismate mutase
VDAGSDPRIAELREQISALDETIVDAVDRRLALVAALKRRKDELGLPFLDAGRERELVDALTATPRIRLSDEAVEEIARAVLAVVKREVARLEAAER